MVAIAVGKTGFTCLHLADTRFTFGRGNIGKSILTFITTVTAIIDVVRIQFDAVRFGVGTTVGITGSTNISTRAGIAQRSRIIFGRTRRITGRTVFHTCAFQHFAAIEFFAVAVAIVVGTGRTIFQVHVAQRQTAAVTERLARQTG